MAASIKTWINDNLPNLEAMDLNGFELENNNLISSTGEALNTLDNDQTTKAIALYAGAGDNYNESGIANAYLLSPQGGQLFPSSLPSGLTIRFVTANSNTGPSTLNAFGTGVKQIRQNEPGLAQIEPGSIVAGTAIQCQYNLANDIWQITSITTSSIADNLPVATQVEMEAGLSTNTVVTPQNAQFHQGSVKAWLVGDVSTPGAIILDSYNIASLVRQARGLFEVTFTNAFSSVNFVTLFQGGETSGAVQFLVKTNSSIAKITTGVSGIILNGAGVLPAGATDPSEEFFSMIVMGDT